jgi:hypothetical protein
MAVGAILDGFCKVLLAVMDEGKPVSPVTVTYSKKHLKPASNSNLTQYF